MLYFWTHFFVPYPDEEESEEDDDEGVDSKFFEEMAKPAFFNSSATSNCEETSTRETVNILPSTSWTVIRNAFSLVNSSNLSMAASLHSEA
jgi:hypothetical protein